LTRYFKHSNFYNNKFISRSRSKIIETISKSIKSIALAELNPVFLEYISDNNNFNFSQVQKSNVDSFLGYNKKDGRYSKQGKLTLNNKN